MYSLTAADMVIRYNDEETILPFTRKYDNDFFNSLNHTFLHTDSESVDYFSKKKRTAMAH